ncbi:hypothetical protein L454_05252 [Escherichia coli BIDMC 19C]|nr:hypothetical protein L454_05252 [Escherichia coli BIDMC 19C]
MVGLEAILRAVHVAFQLRIAQVAKRVDAADELVELEDRAPRRVRRGVGAQLADQRALRHFLQPECGDDPVDVRLLAMDEIAVDFPDWPNQARLILCWIVSAVEFFQLRVEVGEARLEPPAKPMQDGEVGLVDAVHVAPVIAVGMMSDVLRYQMSNTWWAS